MLKGCVAVLHMDDLVPEIPSFAEMAFTTARGAGADRDPPRPDACDQWGFGDRAGAGGPPDADTLFRSAGGWWVLRVEVQFGDETYQIG